MIERKTKSIGVRITPKTRKTLEDFVEVESKRIGYKITLSSLIEKIIDDWIEEKGDKAKVKRGA